MNSTIASQTPSAGYSTVTGAGGSFEGYFCSPKPGVAVVGAVLLLHEIFGITSKIRRYAQDYADAGFQVLVPDLFWRHGARVELAHDSESLKHAIARLKVFDLQASLVDIAAAANVLKLGYPELPLSIIGFCLGGKLTIMSRSVGLADAYVAYYGVDVEKLEGALDTIDSPLMLHYGAQDNYVPPAVVRSFSRRLGQNVTLHFYDDAGHAFYAPGRDPVSDLSKERTLNFLPRRLSSAAA